MTTIPVECQETVNRLARLLNLLVIRQRAAEIALADLGITEAQWKQAYAKAQGIDVWGAMISGDNLDSLTTTLDMLLRRLLPAEAEHPVEDAAPAAV